jgi:transposase
MAPPKEYQAVKDAARFGVEVIFLPVAHPELNPIELMWARVKDQLIKENATMTLSFVEDHGK